MDTLVKFPNWQAQLELEFSANPQGRTILSDRRHIGPLVVQRPFYPEQDTCHVYVLHPPGGIAGGDQLKINATSQKQAHCLITTPAANKFYRSDGPIAVQQQHLHIAKNSIMEWLPQETIYFDGCKVETDTRIELKAGAKFIGWEIMCLGRPASQDFFSHGYCKQRIELWQDNEPLFIERALLEGNSEVLTQPWGLNGCTTTGTMIVTPASKAELAIVRKNVQANGPEGSSKNKQKFSATLINNVLVMRYLGKQGEDAKKYFTRAWQAIRPSLISKQACIPRIWNT